MSSRTIYLSRLIGIYCLLVIPALVLHGQATVDAVAALFRDPGLMMMVSIFTLTAGLAMVLAHNLWSGGARVVVVTLVGWLVLLKGLVFLLLPAPLEAEFILRVLGHPPLFYLCMVPSLLFGIYLTWAGFTTKATA